MLKVVGYMEIISHRGYWKESSEKNTEVSFERSFSLGFGTETDLRDFLGDIVISHDIPLEKKITFSEFLKCYKDSKCKGRLALNIKSDGLHQNIISQLIKSGVDNYFVFDMSIPDAIKSLEYGLNTFLRFSEYEPKNQLWEKCVGIWYDSFGTNKLDFVLIKEIIDEGKDVCIVSSELHNRDFESQWEIIKQLPKKYLESKSLLLCTDIPEKASEYFYE